MKLMTGPTLGQEMRQHKLAYAILLAMLSILAVAFMAAWPNRWLERAVIIGIGMCYMSWGIVTHLHAEHLSRRIAMEYVTVALLAMVLLWLITI